MAATIFNLSPQQLNWPEFSIDLACAAGADDVDVLWSQQAWQATDQTEAAIDSRWSAALADAAANGRRLYDGGLCRMDSVKVAGGKIEFSLRPATYRQFVGTNMSRLSADCAQSAQLADPLGVSANLITADGFLVMGVRAGHLAFHGGMVHPFGGIVEPCVEHCRDDRPGVPDPFRAILAELREEASLTAEHIESLKLVGIVKDRAIIQPEAVFDVALNVNLADLRKMIASARDGDEHAAIFPLADTGESLASFVFGRPEGGNPTPVARGAAALHSVKKFGANWFSSSPGRTIR